MYATARPFVPFRHVGNSRVVCFDIELPRSLRLENHNGVGLLAVVDLTN